jgi:putative membrane protein
VQQRDDRLPARAVKRPGCSSGIQPTLLGGIREPTDEPWVVTEPDRPFDEARDATRRTRLANERTYLAWWRTGLTTLAVSFAAGRLVPDLSKGPSWPFEAIGVAFAVVGIAFIAYGYVRQKDVDEALARGEYATLKHRVAFMFSAVGVLLGLATLVLVVIHPK